MPRRPPLGLVALLLALPACSPGGADEGAAAVPAVNGLSTTTLLVCRSLKGLLPEEIAPGVAKRRATPLSDSTAAWGDPAVALRCGVTEGSEKDEPYEFDGVRWAMHDTGASRTWTTRGLDVNVAVEVPDTYDGQAEMLGRLAKPLRDAQDQR